MVGGSGSHPVTDVLLLADSATIVLIILPTYRESSGMLVPGNLSYFYTHVIGNAR